MSPQSPPSLIANHGCWLPRVNGWHGVQPLPRRHVHNGAATPLDVTSTTGLHNGHRRRRGCMGSGSWCDVHGFRTFMGSVRSWVRLDTLRGSMGQRVPWVRNTRIER